jgi:hypothetical protein
MILSERRVGIPVDNPITPALLGKDIRDPIPAGARTVTLHPTVVGTTDDTWG